MSATFATLVESLRSCSTEEKLELKSVLERALIDERRREIKAHGRRSLEELKRGKLKFSSSISELKKSLAEKVSVKSIDKSWRFREKIWTSSGVRQRCGRGTARAPGQCADAPSFLSRLFTSLEGKSSERISPTINVREIRPST
jgi:hypothetical protein